MIGITDADLFSRERAEAYVRDDRRVLETGECIVDRVELAPDPHNSITWFLTTKIPLYGRHGDILGVACIARGLGDAREKLQPYTEMNAALDHVQRHYARPVTVEELARQVHLSPSQFNRRFKRLFQITPARHLLNVRIHAACHLLSTTRQTIASIAQEAGFYDQSHFSRSFRRVMHCSPGAYRAQGRRNPW